MTFLRTVRVQMAACAAMITLAMITWAGSAMADDGCDAQCQIARKAQDPLANIRALIFDGTVGFDTQRDPLSYATQIQPVYSLPTDGGYNVILRGTLPVMGLRNGVVVPPLGSDPRGGSQYDWGVGDTILQAFFSPKSNGDLKVGFGPQLSLPTRTNGTFAGPGWGAGVTAVVTGFAGPVSYGAIVGQHWGQDGFSLATLNPVLMYNTDLFGGTYLGYANTITHNWQAPSGQRWQVPLGLTFGKTFARPNGSAVDVNLGLYRLVKRPTGGAENQLKFAVSLIWP